MTAARPARPFETSRHRRSAHQSQDPRLRVGAGYVVPASMGHVRDLPPDALGVDVEHNFQPTYHLLRQKAKTLQALRAWLEGAQELYLATDPNRVPAVGERVRQQDQQFRQALISGSEVRGRPAANPPDQLAARSIVGTLGDIAPTPEPAPATTDRISEA